MYVVSTQRVPRNICPHPGTSFSCISMGLLPNTSNCGYAYAGNAGNVFPATAGKQSRHASRHVRDARAVMHAGMANSRFPLNSTVGENVPGIPGACATRDFTYLVRGPWHVMPWKRFPCYNQVNVSSMSTSAVMAWNVSVPRAPFTNMIKLILFHTLLGVMRSL